MYSPPVSAGDPSSLRGRLYTLWLCMLGGGRDLDACSWRVSLKSIVASRLYYTQQSNSNEMVQVDPASMRRDG